MTDRELYGCFDHEYSPEGFPKLKFGSPEPMPSEREQFTRYCHLNCITDPAEIARLWKEEAARRKAAVPRG